MAELDESSVDAIVTDPPYGLEFMGKEWDRLGDIGKTSHDGTTASSGSRDRSLGAAFGRLGGVAHHGSSNRKCGKCQRWEWDHPGRKCECPTPDLPNVKAHQSRLMQEWHQAWATEALRVLKPGGHLLAFGGTRTFHRLTCAIEDAGFEIRDCLAWMFGSGFPKSLSPYRSTLSGLCRSTEHARRAVRISEWSRVESSGAKEPIALALAETLPEGELALLIRTGAEDDSCVRMAMSPSQLAAVGISLNTDSSWKDCSVVSFGGTSMSITETATRLTTDPRILNFLRSAPTPPSITPDEFRPDGCRCDAWPAAESLNGGGTKWSATPLLIARASATARVAPLEPLGSALKPAYEPIVLARKPLVGTVAANVQAHGTGALNVDGCRIEHDGRGVWGNHGQNPENHLTEPGSEGTTMGTGWNRPRSRRHASGRWPANVALDEEAAAQLDAQSGERKGPGGPAKKGSASAWPGGDYQGTIYPKETGGASRFFYVAKASRSEKNAGLHGSDGGDGKGGLMQPLEGTRVTSGGNGRWPANVVLDEAAAGMLDEQSGVTRSNPMGGRGQYAGGCFGGGATSGEYHGDQGGASRFFATFQEEATSGQILAMDSGEAAETTSVSRRHPRGSANLRNDAADKPGGDYLARHGEAPELVRFRYCAKASRSERNAGLEGFEERTKRILNGGIPSAVNSDPRGMSGGGDRQAKNHHPTVKPIALMRWLCRLVTPPGGLILDPFTGSGTTGCAAVLEGFDFLGIEREAEYVAIAEARIAHWASQPQQLKLDAA